MDLDGAGAQRRGGQVPAAGGDGDRGGLRQRQPGDRRVTATVARDGERDLRDRGGRGVDHAGRARRGDHDRGRGGHRRRCRAGRRGGGAPGPGGRGGGGGGGPGGGGGGGGGGGKTDGRPFPPGGEEEEKGNGAGAIERGGERAGRLAAGVEGRAGPAARRDGVRVTVEVPGHRVALV